MAWAAYGACKSVRNEVTGGGWKKVVVEVKKRGL